MARGASQCSAETSHELAFWDVQQVSLGSGDSDAIVITGRLRGEIEGVVPPMLPRRCLLLVARRPRGHAMPPRQKRHRRVA
eukprot:7915606-Pyramimonas_sp.AAC.2